MAIKITKKTKESSQELAKRFTKAVKKSGVLLEMRKKAFATRVKSKNLKKRGTLRKIQLRENYDQQKKLGKI
ncbi:MAG TPA: hypothetical protein PLA41_00185 [Candidatus Pacearchaeota archaeon]|nr:hypothetical protein [Candidatus Parcubacteria bacterium]HNZ83880.1 hypothetical protein [Candidatus Pacearchaeota archaeon]HOU45560.1 hypothetical protein [Candidatus Pacearchaeota archaeon]HPM08423.1 hypothetical protein [Candidatus Pacearchaeota archaeon]HQI74283.1 hypothetical protein [Candidatus Pacearchaeota archaeon]